MHCANIKLKFYLSGYDMLLAFTNTFSLLRINKPQPDNRELIQGGAPENCLAILNNFYNDGVHWHDVACHHKKPWVCEESEALLKYVRYSNPNSGV